MSRRPLALLRPFDVSTAAGRGRERYRRIGLAMAGSALQRAANIAVTLVTVPLLLGYLGAERYGLFVTVTSLVALTAFADLGIGSGLVNVVATSTARRDIAAVRVYIASAYVILTAIPLALGAAFAVAYGFIPWHRVFNLASADAAAEAGPAVAAFVVAFLVSLPLGVVQRVQLGLQESVMNGLWTALGLLLALLGVILAVAANAPLWILILTFSGAPAFALMGNTALLFGFKRRYLRPSITDAEWNAGRYILRLGFFFFLIQLGASLGYASDNVIIAQVLGAEAVPQYSVPFRLSTFLPILLSFVLMPLWPAYGEALERGDIEWVRKAFQTSIALGFAITLPGAVLLVLFGRPLLHAWAGEGIDASFSLLIGLALWSTLSGAINGPLAVLLNGAGMIRLQGGLAILMALANIPLSIVLVAAVGVEGAIYGTLLSHGLVVVVPSSIVLGRWFRTLSPTELSR